MEGKKNKQISKEELIMSIKTNLKITLIYWISIYGLYILCTVKLYSYEYSSKVQLLFTLFILTWFIALFLRTDKKKPTSAQESFEGAMVHYRYKRIWSSFFALLLIAITIIYITKTHERYYFNIKYFMQYEKVVNAKALASRNSTTHSEAEDIANLMTDSSRIVGECFISQLKGYRVLITDAASGSRFYSLFITRNGGVTWSFLNRDPFSKTLGSSSGVFFMNENIGFLTLGHSSNSEGQLYRTVDGGKSFKEVALRDSSHISFDYPEVPFVKDGILSMYLSQGDNGDYNGGSKGLFQSKDNGATWQFVMEVERSEFEKN